MGKGGLLIWRLVMLLLRGRQCVCLKSGYGCVGRLTTMRNLDDGFGAH